MSTTELRKRKTPTKDGDAIVIAKASDVEVVPVSLGAGWRCVQATVLVLVIINVILALWAAVLADDVRSLVRTQFNGTTPVSGPRFETMAVVKENMMIDAFRRKRHHP